MSFEIRRVDEIDTKDEAMRFIAVVLSSGVATLSPSFNIAVELSERFNISVKDMLEWRRKRAQNT